MDQLLPVIQVLLAHGAVESVAGGQPLQNLGRNVFFLRGIEGAARHGMHHKKRHGDEHHDGQKTCK